MSEKKVGNYYTIPGKNYTIIIKPCSSSNNKDKTNINFENCEKIIRKENNIPASSILTILMIEIENYNNHSLINQVEYRIFDENKKPLDISKCKDTNIIIDYSIKDSALALLDKNLISEFNNLGINIFFINDSFFNDLCVPFDYHDTDIILEDRYNLIYQNFSICEEGCNNTNIDLEKTIISCQCKVKQNMNNKIMNVNLQQFNKDKLKSNNIDVLKCSDLIFKLNNKSKNIGFIIFTTLAFINLILIIIHMIRGIKSVSDFVYDNMKNYNYIKEGNIKFFEDNKLDNNGNSKSNKTKENFLIKKSSALDKKGKNYSLNINQNNILGNSSRRNMKPNNYILPKNTKKNKNKISNPPGNNTFVKKKKGITKKTVPKFKNNKEEKNEENFGIIKINLDKARGKCYPYESGRTLHNYTFKDLNNFERRNIFQILYIFLLSKQIIFHTLLERSPLVPFQIKLIIFSFAICFDLSVNALFYSNTNISEKASSSQSLISFTLSNNKLIITISTLFSLIFIPIVIKFSKIDYVIRDIFSKEEEKIRKDKKYKTDCLKKMKIFSEVENALKCYKIKLILFLIFNFLFMLFFWYFITAFCQVYPNTQINWLFNCISSVLVRFLFEVLICFLFAKLYLMAASVDYWTFYKFMLFVYDFSC